MLIAELQQAFPRAGRLEKIVVRTEKRGVTACVDEAMLRADHGIEGDHRATRPGSPRQVTLIQSEHLRAIASIAGLDTIEAEVLRRNLVVSGINLAALKGLRFRVGDALLETTGLCHPCSRMEAALGAGGYNAMRGHGGITAIVREGGIVRVSDPVVAVVDAAPPA